MIFLRENKPKLKPYIIQSAIAFAIIAVILILDLTTKAYVQNSYTEWNGSITVISGFFYITYVKNTGGAWSIGGGCDSFLPVVITFTMIVVCALLFIIFFPDKRKPMILTCVLAAVTAGAMGNMIDRMAFGYVRDFIKFIIFGYNFPVFNIADMALVVGVITLIVIMCIYFFKPEKKKEESVEESKEENQVDNVDNSSDNSSVGGDKN